MEHFTLFDTFLRPEHVIVHHDKSCLSISVCKVRLGFVVMTFGAVYFTFPFLSVATTVWASCSLPSALTYST